MSLKFRIAYFAHSVRSDWNNGNAHFLRGLLRHMGRIGHEVTIFEPDHNWSFTNLENEQAGPASLQQFAAEYSDLRLFTYCLNVIGPAALTAKTLQPFDIVFVHEWNSPELVHHLLDLRKQCSFRMLFHDTHHRASSSPTALRLLALDQFDGIVAFGEALRRIYQHQFNLPQVWTLHEAADTDVFYPRSKPEQLDDVVWIGNWGDNERSREIEEFLLQPAANLKRQRFAIYGVRYPEEGLRALQAAGVVYRGYLPNLSAPVVYAAAHLTVHIPRQQYVTAMQGIPTIRVFEALACGIPLLSAPWEDSEHLFRPGDYLTVRSSEETQAAICSLIENPNQAREQAQRGQETVLARHTCRHRAEQLSSYCEEVLQ